MNKKPEQTKKTRKKREEPTTEQLEQRARDFAKRFYEQYGNAMSILAKE